MADPQEDLIALARIKAAQDELAKEKAKIEARLIESFMSTGKKSLSADLDGQTINGTFVAPERTVIDAAGLEAALTKSQWEKVTSRVLDKEKLEAAVVQKIVDMQVVAQHSETKPTKPFVKVSGKVPDKDLASGVVMDAGIVTVFGSNGKPVTGATTKRVAKKPAKKAARPRAGK